MEWRRISERAEELLFKHHDVIKLVVVSEGGPEVEDVVQEVVGQRQPDHLALWRPFLSCSYFDSRASLVRRQRTDRGWQRTTRTKIASERPRPHAANRPSGPHAV